MNYDDEDRQRRQRRKESTTGIAIYCLVILAILMFALSAAGLGPKGR